MHQPQQDIPPTPAAQAQSPFTAAHEQKRNLLFLSLMGIFLTNAIVAEIVGPKIFSLESLLGLPPAQIPLLEGVKLDFNLTAGVLIWPVVFVTSDLINEYFGKAGVRRISFLTAALITYSFGVLWGVAKLPPAQFWLEINATDAQGRPFDINFAFDRLFLQSMGIILGSLTAFLIGQLLDVHAFQWLRRLSGSRHIWLRATGSTLFSQLIDSFVVLFIAFYVFGNWSWQQVISVGIMNYLYKFLVAILATPLLYAAHIGIERYLEKHYAHHLSEEAARSNYFSDKR